MDSSNTPLYRELLNQAKLIIDSDREKGRIFESGKRWDEKDQAAFEKVPLETLLDDPYYGGGRYSYDPETGEEHGGLWDSHRSDIIQLWKARKERGVLTFVNESGIGSGKTNAFKHILRLLVLEVITKVDPIAYYGLDPTGLGISFVCMSRNAKLAKGVTFETVLPAFDCPFFKEYFPPQVDLQKMKDTQRYPSKLRFPKGIVIFPGTGSALSALGYNLFGGGIDEANFLEVVDESRKAFTGRYYDAAELMFNTVKTRMTSRFEPNRLLRQNKLPGLLALFSNHRGKSAFLERMILRSHRDKTIFVRRRATWDAQPANRYCGRTFKYDVNNRRILKSAA